MKTTITIMIITKNNKSITKTMLVIRMITMITWMCKGERLYVNIDTS